jgi:hypothetical protein
MPTPTTPSPFYKSLVQALLPTKQTTQVTAAETETATRWEVNQGAARAVTQKNKLTGLETETRTRWEAFAVQNGGLGFDEFVRGSAVVPNGVKAAKPAIATPYQGARPVSQKTVVTQAETLSETKWKVEGEQGAESYTPVQQQTRLENFDTKTRTRWVFDQKTDLKALQGLADKLPVAP